MSREFCKDCMYMRRSLFGRMICHSDDTAKYNPLTGKKKFRNCEYVRRFVNISDETCPSFAQSFTGMQDENMICPKCGKVLQETNDGSFICTPECGYRINILPEYEHCS